MILSVLRPLRALKRARWWGASFSSPAPSAPTPLAALAALPNVRLDDTSTRWLAREETIDAARAALAAAPRAPVTSLPVLALSTAAPTGALVAVPASLASAPVRRDLVHRVVVWQAKGARTTLYKGKSRGEVRGGGRKPWKQKGTGRARAGSSRSPLWVGGGAAHPPQHREWAESLQKRVRRAGLAAAVAAKLADGRVTVVDALRLAPAPPAAGAPPAGEAGAAASAAGGEGAAASGRTRDARAMLAAHGVWGRRSLFVGADVPSAFACALANVPRAHALPALGANVAAVVAAERLFVTPEGLAAIEARCAQLVRGSRRD